MAYENLDLQGRYPFVHDNGEDYNVDNWIYATLTLSSCGGVASIPIADGIETTNVGSIVDSVIWWLLLTPLCTRRL